MTKLHSFGGSALDRHVFDFEAVADAPATEADVAQALETPPAGEPASDTAASAPAVETGLPSPEPDAPAGPPQIDWSDPQVQSAIAERTRAEVAAMVAEAQAAEAAASGQPAAPPVPDPFADDYEEQLAAYVQWQVKQGTAAFQPVVEASQAREAQEWTNQQLEQLGVPAPEDGLAEGDVSTRDAVLYLAGGIESAASAAGLRVDGTTILQHAWGQLQARDARIGKAAVAAHIAELERLDGAPKDPSGPPASEGLMDADDELAVARLLAERRSQ